MATAPPPLPLPDPSSSKRLTSLADVSRALADVGARERAIDARLDVAREAARVSSGFRQTLRPENQQAQDGQNHDLANANIEHG